MAQLGDENIKDLYNILSDLKGNSQTIVVKMDQIYDSIESLEETVEMIKSSVSSQRDRITVIEQSIPEHLKETLTLLKNTQESYNKLIWAISAAAIAGLMNSIFKFIG